MRLALALLLLVAARPVAAEMTPQPTAILQGLDKITARVSRFPAPVGQPVNFGTLAILVRDCEKSAPEDPPQNAAFVEIYETRPGEERVRRFSGWMFSSSPALSALEHPVYDVNLLECKPAAAAAAAAAPGPPAPPPPPPPHEPPPKSAAASSRGKTAR
jgi:hypothetical protein